MNPDDLAKILDELGKRLGPAGSHVLDLAVKQQIIEGVYWLVALVVLAVVSIVATLAIRTAFRENNIEHTEGDSYIPMSWRLTGYAVAWTAFIVVLVCVGANVVSKLLNPEYAAIHDILQQLR